LRIGICASNPILEGVKKLAQLWTAAVLAAPLLLAGCTATSTDAAQPLQPQAPAQVQTVKTPEPFISKAATTVFVPDLADLPVNEAEPVLSKMGFKIKWAKKMSERSLWVVSSSTPGRGKEVTRGATLTLDVKKSSDSEFASEPAPAAPKPAAPSVPKRSSTSSRISGSGSASVGRAPRASSSGTSASVSGSSADGDVYYANCTAVENAGKAPIYPGDPGWQDKFDRDHDGMGCDQ
jgi:hypothetical protein